MALMSDHDNTNGTSLWDTGNMMSPIFTELDIWERSVFVHPSTLERLVGKRLVLGRYCRGTGRAVDSGGQKNTKSQRLWLIAVNRHDQFDAPAAA